jgi:Fungal specific transcription factor domain
MKSLLERLGTLETMLEVDPGSSLTGQSPPTDQPWLQSNDDEAVRTTEPPTTSSAFGPEPALRSRSEDTRSHSGQPMDASRHTGQQPRTNSQGFSPGPLSPICTGEHDVVGGLLSTNGHLIYDRVNERLRYYGPTSVFHVYADLNPAASTRPESREQTKQIERIINDLPTETHDYLMDRYWLYHNSVLPIVDRRAFEEDKENGRSRYYSGFLHICLLALGFRYADPSRPETQKVNVWSRESSLHKEAKYLFDYELEKPGGIPSIQALLILCDLEYSVGRYNMGSMYAGMSYRLGLDLGINLDWTPLQLSEQEIQTRQRVIWGCVVYDKFWALFLGRPTSIKISDLAVRRPTDGFALQGNHQLPELANNLETQVYAAMIDLMDLITNITERLDRRPDVRKASTSADLTAAALDQELNAWYRGLPRQLQWKSADLGMAPFNFFLLHRQYCAAQILLHRPFTQYRPVVLGADAQVGELGKAPESVNSLSMLSRTICFDNAIRIAQIFQQQGLTFANEQIFITDIQHAGTAATALIAGMTRTKDSRKHLEPLRHLRTLAQALKAMSPAYLPAERMFKFVEYICEEWGWVLDDLPRAAKDLAAMVPPSSQSNLGDRRAWDTSRRQKMSFSRSATTGTDGPSIPQNLHLRAGHVPVAPMPGLGFNDQTSARSLDSMFWEHVQY